MHRKVDDATVGSHSYHQYGLLVINNDFTKVAILISDQNQINGSGTLII